MNAVILDTGCANLFSLTSALERLGYYPKVSNEADIIKNADKLFLPGVGTAQSAMNQIYKSRLIDLIKEYNNPVLGICLGMQLLGTHSDENNGISTLNIMKQPVKYMKDVCLPLPHMGWNQIFYKKDHALFQGIKNGTYFYFVHNFAMKINCYTIATCKYGESFSAAVQKNNFYGVQFHPERSGIMGAKLLKNFLEM